MMLALDIKPEQASPSPLSTGDLQKEPKVSFAELLKGIKIGKKDADIIQNGAFALSLEFKSTKEVSPKNNVLLKMFSKNGKSDISLLENSSELEPELKTNDTVLSSKDMRALVLNAKNYLKTQIAKSDSYKNQDIKEFPKTLKGLTALAKKVGVDVSAIKIETFIDKSSALKMQTQSPHAKTKLSFEETNPHAKIKSSLQMQQNAVSSDLKLSENTTEYTIQQLVATKQFKDGQKNQKEKADEALQLLLRGEKPSLDNSKLTADFSVQTAKVITPLATSEPLKSLESLLHETTASSEDTVSSGKTETIAVHKADSFEVKLNEAKQMIRYLSQDVKTAIEDYKSPFTRVKVQLNPQRLGEIDLTVVQRGKNLHVNLSSNNTAINTLAMNANELKTQLQNSGINNASLNFSNNSQNGEQANQHHQQNKARDEYDYFETEETNEEILNSLEIVVPNYA